MKSVRIPAHSALILIVAAVTATTPACSQRQPSAPSRPTATTGAAAADMEGEEGHEALSAATLQELAQAREATAKYHDVEQAIADGYVKGGVRPGEGIHYLNASLVDCTFDPAHPEALIYVPSGQGLRLVGMEYSVPSSCTATAPEGFSGDADEWEANAEGRNVWGLIVWLWLANPNGIFAEPPHPNIH